uniref:Protein tyrosine phosphatase 4A2b n=1 Tax=Gadus morhua TaxID=8049 RepID=A0A8C5B6U0_GADMO
MGRLANMNRPAAVEITYECMKFLITHNPTNATLNKFTEELKKFEVNTLVRVCDATYDKAPVEKEGIQVLDWPFDDGAPPPTQIVDDWLNLLKTKFREEPGCCIAVHCVAGLGRAPVLVALALIECGMKYEDAVQFIRLYNECTSSPLDHSSHVCIASCVLPGVRMTPKHADITRDPNLPCAFIPRGRITGDQPTQRR